MVCCATFTKCDFHFFDVYALKLLHFETVFVLCDIFYHMTLTLWKCNVIKLSLYETLKLNWCYILWCLRNVLLCLVATTLQRSPLEIHMFGSKDRGKLSEKLHVSCTERRIFKTEHLYTSAWKYGPKCSVQSQLSVSGHAQNLTAHRIQALLRHILL
jgi:hypothetical protein